MTVYVIMEGDFPRAVITNQDWALNIVRSRNLAIASRNKVENLPVGARFSQNWRVEHLTVDEEPK